METYPLLIPNLRWLIRTTPEWHRAYNLVVTKDFGPQLPDYHDCGEAWQYLGTYLKHQDTDTWYHHFRHYYHPSTGKQENLYVISQDNNPALYNFR